MFVKQRQETQYEAFAYLLNTYMTRRFMRAAHLAERLDIHRATVGRWLSGTHRPEPDVVVRVADMLLLTGRAREQFLLCWFGEASLD